MKTQRELEAFLEALSVLCRQHGLFLCGDENGLRVRGDTGKWGDSSFLYDQDVAIEMDSEDNYIVYPENSGNVW